MARAGLPWQLEGTVDPAGYADLLLAACRHRLAGLLVLSSGTAVTKIFFSGGMVAFASSNLPADRLGDVLLRKGIISEEQYRESSRRIVESGKKQGTILVEMGAVDPKGLFQGLIVQVNEVTQNPFLWKEIYYSYSPIADRSQESIVLKLHPGVLAREGLWRIPGGPSTVTSSGIVYRLVPDPNPPAAELALSNLDRTILEAVPGGATSSQVAAGARIPPWIVARSFTILARLGLIEAADAPDRPTQSRGSLPGVDEEQLRHQLVALAERRGMMFPHQLLGVPPWVDANELRRHYIQRAKELHPDRFLRPSLVDLAPSAAEVATALQEACAAMLGPGGAADPAGEGDRELAAERYRLGQELALLGRGRQAVEHLRWAVRLDPAECRYRQGLAEALLGEGERLAECRRHLEEAARRCGETPELLVLLGRVFRRGGAVTRAAEYFRRALLLDSQNEDARRELLLLHSRQAPPAKHDDFLEGFAADGAPPAP